MVCPNCKKEIDSNSKFCEHCGAPISAQPIEENTAAEVPAPVEQPLEVAQEPTATPIEEKPAYGAENPYFTPIDYIPPQPQEPNEKPKKKKNKKLAVIISVIAAVVVILVAALFSWQYIAKASAGNISYYLWRESKTVEKLVNTEAIEDAFKIDDFTVSADFDSDDEGSAYKNSVKASYDDDNKEFVGTYKLSDGESNYTFKLCYGDKKLGLSAPTDLTSMLLDEKAAGKNDTYYLDLEDIIGDDSLLNGTIDASDILEILKETEKEALDKDCVSTKIGVVNGNVCNTTTIKLTEEDAANLVAELWSQAKENKHFKESFDNYLKVAFDTGLAGDYDTVDSFKDEAYKQIDDSIKEMQENTDDKSVYEFYVSCSLFGNVVSRGANIYYDDELTDKVVINSKSNGLEFTYNDDDDYELNIDYTADVTNKSINGEVDVKAGSKDTHDDFKVKFENISCGNVGGVDVIVGKLTAKGKIDGNDFDATIEAKDGDKYSLSIDSSSDGEELLKENAELTLSDKADMSNYEKPSSENSKPFSDLFRTSDFAKDYSSDLTEDNDEDLDESERIAREILDSYGYDYDEDDFSELVDIYSKSLTGELNGLDGTTTTQSDGE